jgi:hypothetical protein
MLGLPFGADITPANESLIAHEWGTFTSVAGEDGKAVQWAPLSGAPDLPCFVNHLSPRNFKFAPGLVRMETPVLYFYAPHSVTLSVDVEFPQGWITEWYPQATRVKPEVSAEFLHVPSFEQGQIDWDSVQLSAGESSEFPSSQGSSRYYAARKTDSAPLRMGEQREKFIFYRGIADFLVPLQPKFASADTVEILNTGPDTIPLAILFENRNGKIGYRLVRDVKASMTLDVPELTGNLAGLRRKLADSLVKFGLYEKEALAMIETWQDSWFEEGMRLFYIVPRAFVDSQLPLKITPEPAEVTRVFVGRIELLSAWTRETIETALSNGDIGTLTKFGRFLDPFLYQIRSENRSFVLSPGAEKYLQQAHIKVGEQLNAASCAQ